MIKKIVNKIMTFDTIIVILAMLNIAFTASFVMLLRAEAYSFAIIQGISLIPMYHTLVKLLNRRREWAALSESFDNHNRRL